MNAALADLRANNGHLTIPGLQRRYPAADAVRRAARRGDMDAFFRAGALGPDAFPDTANGQAGIHTNPGPWLEHMWAYFQTHHAEDDAAQAFLHGFLSHCAVDATTHDWVNAFAGGQWPPLERLLANDRAAIENVSVHLALEATLDDRLKPHVESHRSIDVPQAALLGCLNDAVRGVVVARPPNVPMNIAWGTAGDTLIDQFEWLVGLRATAEPWRSAASTDTRRWVFDFTSEALADWIKVNTIAWQRIIIGDLDMLETLVDEWSRLLDKLRKRYERNKPALAVFLNVLRAFGLLPIPPGIPIDQVIARFVEQKAKALLEEALGPRLEILSSINRARVGSPNIKALLGNQWDNARQPLEADFPAVEDLNQNVAFKASPVLHNALIAAKLALMSPASLRAVAHELGQKLPDGAAFVPQFIATLDGSGQQHTGVLGALYSERIFIKTTSYYQRHSGHVDRQAQPLPMCTSDEARFASVRVRTGSERTQSMVSLGVKLKSGLTHWMEMDTNYYNDRMEFELDHYLLDLPFVPVPTPTWPKLADITELFLKKRATGDEWRCLWFEIRFNAGAARRFTVNKLFTRRDNIWSSGTITLS
jgi:hypothetical protein